MSVGALSGIRVLDLSTQLPGPYCSMILGDLGAEVIKIEPPGKGDYAREVFPGIKKEGAYFLAINRNKRSLTLDLKSTRGKEIFLKLVRKSDVVLEGFRPGVIDRLGIGYNDLRKLNSKIVFCSISGYGQYGPHAEKAGHDVNYISIAGITGSTGTKQGKPVIPGVLIADMSGALSAALSILAALLAKEKTGSGQYIDIALLDSALALLAIQTAKYFADGETPKPSGEHFCGQFACYNIYRTKDGKHMSLGAIEPKFWAAFCKAIGREELIENQYAPGKEAEQLIEKMGEIYAERTRDEWVEFLKDVDCCCEPVNDFNEVFSHPQVVSRNMVAEIEHPTEGKIRMINFPGKFSEASTTIRLEPPSLGQHTIDILKELGMTEEEIKELEKEKVV